MDIFQRKRLLIVLTVASLAGILSLYAYTLTLGPTIKAIGNIGPGDVGSVVQTKGLMGTFTLTSTGSFIFSMVDPQDLSSIGVFIPSDVYERIEIKDKLIPGAEVEVRGEVQEYRGKLEIYVSTGQFVKVTKEASQNSLSIEVLARNPQAFRGMMVSVRGRISDLKTLRGDGVVGTSFLLSNESGGSTYSISCVIFGWDWSYDSRGIENGAEFSFVGILDYYENMAAWQITSNQFTLRP